MTGGQAVIVGGNGAGVVNVGIGKAKERFPAQKRAVVDALKRPHFLEARWHNTIAHDTFCKEGATKVTLLRAKPGTGLKCNQTVRSVLASIGVKDCVAKVHGSRDLLCTLRGTLRALSNVGRQVRRSCSWFIGTIAEDAGNDPGTLAGVA